MHAFNRLLFQSIFVGWDQLDLGDFQTGWASVVREAPDARDNQPFRLAWQLVFPISYTWVEIKFVEAKHGLEVAFVVELRRLPASKELPRELSIGVSHSDSEKDTCSDSEMATDDETRAWLNDHWRAIGANDGEPKQIKRDRPVFPRYERYRF